MSEPILRIPLSEAEAHHLRLAALEALVAKLEAENAALRAKMALPAPAPQKALAYDHTPTVATRRDAHGRRFWDGAGWVMSADEAYASATLDVETLRALKPRGSKLVALADVPALLAEDAKKAKEKAPAAAAIDADVVDAIAEAAYERARKRTVDSIDRSASHFHACPTCGAGAGYDCNWRIDDTASWSLAQAHDARRALVVIADAAEVRP